MKTDGNLHTGEKVWRTFLKNSRQNTAARSPTQESAALLKETPSAAS